MAKNKRKKKAGTPQKSYVDPSASPGPPFDNETSSVPLVDGSDFSWLDKDTMPLIDDEALHGDCMAVLDTLRERKLGLGKFIWAVNYGNTVSRSDRRMCDARSDFRGRFLIPTLHNVRVPPRTSAKGARTPGAKDSLDRFALALVGLQIRQEMQSFEKEYGGVKVEELSKAEPLEGINYDMVEQKVHACAPTLFRLLYMLGTCIFRRSRWESNGSDANFVSLRLCMDVALIMYLVFCDFHMLYCIPYVKLQQYTAKTPWLLLPGEACSESCYRNLRQNEPQRQSLINYKHTIEALRSYQGRDDQGARGVPNSDCSRQHSHPTRRPIATRK